MSDYFDKLFIFEMANNHMGDVNHGLKIINEFHNIAKEFPFKFAFKFQYRNLDTFIHPDYKNRMDIKYIKRFSETRLTSEQFLILKNEVDRLGFISICTPFDELSVDLIEQHNYSIIKVGSCSFTDWPLLERIVKTDKPVILSTAGASLNDIDNVVAFFEHREKDFCIMHCVGSYPTPYDQLEMSQIDFFKQRYKNMPIGFSTHESPDSIDPIKIAIAKGSQVFERHVGIKTEQYNINLYSSTPSQIKSWLNSAMNAYEMCGISNSRRIISDKEYNDLNGLKRGVFAKCNLKKDSFIEADQTFLAIPNSEGQVVANDLSKYSEYKLLDSISTKQPILFNKLKQNNKREKIYPIIGKICKLIKASGVILPNKLNLEISHHYGLDNFDKWGCSIITCINREYCKKIIILLPGQKNPMHFHKQKEETFHVLHGDITVNMNGREEKHCTGELIVVERESKHNFTSKNGAVFEEVSTTHYPHDSFYNDESIMKNTRRKTVLTFWNDWLEEF